MTVSVDDFANQGSAIIEAMTSGDVQLGVVGGLPTISAIAAGKPFKAYSSVNISVDGFKLVAGKDSGITSIEDLKGKKVAVKFASNEHQMTLALIANAGLTTADVEVINMSAEDSLTSLLSGAVDAALLKGEQTDAAVEGGGAVIADNSGTGVITNFLIGRDDFAEEHPEVVEGVIRVLDRTKKWIDENEEEAISIYADKTDTDAESAATNFYSRDRAIGISEDYFVQPLVTSIEFSLEQGLIENEITIDDVIDTDFYDNAGIS